MKTDEKLPYVMKFKTDKFFVFVYMLVAFFFLAQFAIIFWIL